MAWLHRRSGRREVVREHLAGTEYDHDQADHARDGGGAREKFPPPLTSPQAKADFLNRQHLKKYNYLEEETLFGYVRNGMDYNAYLNKEPEFEKYSLIPPAEIESDVKVIDNMMRPLLDPVTVWRGVDPDQLAEMSRVGARFENDGYTSTTLNESFANKFWGPGYGSVLQVQLPPGTPVVWAEGPQADVHQMTENAQQEIVVGRDSIFEVVSTEPYVIKWVGNG